MGLHSQANYSILAEFNSIDIRECSVPFSTTCENILNATFVRMNYLCFIRDKLKKLLIWYANFITV